MNKSRGLNRNQIKWLAIIAMLIDHIAWAFVPTLSAEGQLMHFIGRLTAPTMAYFVAEGYLHTHNVKKYLLRMGIFAIVSWAPFTYFEYGCWPIMFQDGKLCFYPYQGVIYTLFLGLAAIYIWDKMQWKKWCKVLAVLGLCIISVVGDWAFFNVLWCLFLYLYRDHPRKKWIAFSIIGLICCCPMLWSDPWWAYFFMVGVFMVPFLMQFLYNGEAGSKNAVNKWFFYLFYPLHLLILGFLHIQL